jgi:hypothetical protein
MGRRTPAMCGVPARFGGFVWFASVRDHSIKYDLARSMFLIGAGFELIFAKRRWHQLQFLTVDGILASPVAARRLRGDAAGWPHARDGVRAANEVDIAFSGSATPSSWAHFPHSCGLQDQSVVPHKRPRDDAVGDWLLRSPLSLPGPRHLRPAGPRLRALCGAARLRLGASARRRRAFLR